MSQNLFSVTIFFVVFREALESAVIISALLSLVEQIVHEQAAPLSREATPARPHTDNSPGSAGSACPPLTTPDPESDVATRGPHILRKLRLQILFGSFVGLAISLALGATFIAVWFTQAKNLWSKSEQIWEGTFQFIASLMILVMGITMLKMESARTMWRIKLLNAFNGKQERGSKAGRWALFLLPMITIMREGLEAVVFVSGVALSEPATSIPIAAIVGLICGLFCGFLVYQFATRTTLKFFLVCMSNLLLLMGAGLFSKAIWAFEENGFLQMLGANNDDSLGTGPGSYDVRGIVWHLNCCNARSGSWSLFNAVLGWQNSATLGSVLSYVFYWLAVIAILIYLKFKEGRTTIFGWESANGKRRREEFRKVKEMPDLSEKSDHETIVAS